MFGINLAFKAAPAISGFSPANFSSLKQWLEADDPGLFQSVEYLDNQLMPIWTDKSGNGNSLTQNAGEHQARLKKNILNGKAVVRFGQDTRDRWMSCDPFASGSATLIVVFKSTNAASWGGDFAKGGFDLISTEPENGLDQWWYFAASGDQSGRSRVFRGDTLTPYLPGPILLGIWNIWTITSDAVKYRIKIDGTAYLEQLPNFTAGDNYLVGGSDFNVPWNKFFEGDIAEILVYSPAISYTQSDQAEEYLREKYNL